MDERGGVDIQVDEESYEIKAIKTFLAGEISIGDLRVSLGLGRAQTYRQVNRYREFGPDGLQSKKKGRSNRAHSSDNRERIMAIVREHYPDFGPTLACEKLSEVHNIRFAVETLRGWMKADGLWVDRRGRQPRVFSPRKPRERRGELVQIDGSYHRWFEKRGDEACLIVFIDDATSELMLLRLVDHETSYNYMNCLKLYIDKFGVPQALFSDRHSIFRVTNPGANREVSLTQFSRACGKLGITVICAKTPQSKGRVERANRTLQDRLVKELRLRNISTVEEANYFLEEYRRIHNKKFARLPLSEENAHSPTSNMDINSLLTYAEHRKVFKDLTISFNKVRIILDNTELSRRAIGKRVVVATSLDGDIEILFDEIPLSYRMFDKIRRVDDAPEIVDHKRLGAALRMATAVCEVEPHHFKRNNHILAGFRKHFEEPDDSKSRELKNAPPEIRRKYEGRSRAALGVHPIVVLESTLRGK